VKIIGVDNVSPEELKGELATGARFVIYQYCISVLVMSFKRASNIYFVRPGENAVTKGLPFSLISLVLGWWGIPWGPIWTISTIVTNLRGGRDVTNDVVRSMTTPVAGVTRQ
jgi:hypothetical protein